MAYSQSPITGAARGASCRLCWRPRLEGPRRRGGRGTKRGPQTGTAAWPCKVPACRSPHGERGGDSRVGQLLRNIQPREEASNEGSEPSRSSMRRARASSKFSPWLGLGRRSASYWRWSVPIKLVGDQVQAPKAKTLERLESGRCPRPSERGHGELQRAALFLR